MLAGSPWVLIRRAAALVWMLVIIGLGAGVISPTAARTLMGDGGCTSLEEPWGCASLYGTMEEATCGGGASENCTICTQDEESFCAPDNEELECQVEDCVLEDYKHVMGGGNN
jgi:hypothetical protein